MITPDRARDQAEEAERLAAIVSYGRDKQRLLAQAAEWRLQAERLEAEQRLVPQSPEPAPLAARMRGWLHRCG